MKKGITAQIRAEITQRPLSVAQLAKMLRLPRSKVNTMVRQMPDALIYDTKPLRYTTKAWRDQQARNPAWRPLPIAMPRRNDFGFDEDIRVAQKITVPQYRFGSSRLG